MAASHSKDFRSTVDKRSMETETTLTPGATFNLADETLTVDKLNSDGTLDAFFADGTPVRFNAKDTAEIAAMDIRDEEAAK